MKEFVRRLYRLALAAAVLALPPALAFAVYGPIILFSPPGSQAYGPKVGTAANGVSLVAWQRNDASSTGVQLRSRSASGALGPVTRISGSNVAAMDMAVAAGGQAIIVWSRMDGSVQARFRQSNGVLSAIMTISAASVSGEPPLAAIDADGDALIVWQRVVGSLKRVQLRAWSKTGVLGAIQTLSPASADALSPVVAMEPDGDALIAWSRQGRIEARFRSKAGAFGGVATLSPAGNGADSPDVAIDADGDAVLVWRGIVSTRSVVQVRARSRIGAWSAIQNIAVLHSSVEPKIAVAANGNAYVVWSHTIDADDVRLRGRGRSSAGELSQVQVLSGSESAHRPDVEMSHAGTALVSWSAITPAGQSVIRARSRTASGVLRPIASLSAFGGGAAGVDGALGANGAALVVWSLATSSGFRVEGKAGP